MSSSTISGRGRLRKVRSRKTGQKSTPSCAHILQYCRRVPRNCSIVCNLSDAESPALSFRKRIGWSLMEKIFRTVDETSLSPKTTFQLLAKMGSRKHRKMKLARFVVLDVLFHIPLPVIRTHRQPIEL